MVYAVRRSIFRLVRSRRLLPALLVLLFVTATLGTLYSMPMDMEGMMATCPLLGSPAAICQMSSQEHLRSWRALFAPVPEVFAAFLLAMLVLCMAFFRDSIVQTLLRRLVQAQQRTRDPSLALFLPLRLALSRGILNSRIYA